MTQWAKWKRRRLQIRHRLERRPRTREQIRTAAYRTVERALELYSALAPENAVIKYLKTRPTA